MAYYIIGEIMLENFRFLEAIDSFKKAVEL